MRAEEKAPPGSPCSRREPCPSPPHQPTAVLQSMRLLPSPGSEDRPGIRNPRSPLLRHSLRWRGEPTRRRFDPKAGSKWIQPVARCPAARVASEFPHCPSRKNRSIGAFRRERFFASPEPPEQRWRIPGENIPASLQFPIPHCRVTWSQFSSKAPAARRRNTRRKSLESYPARLLRYRIGCRY